MREVSETDASSSDTESEVSESDSESDSDDLDESDSASTAAGSGFGIRKGGKESATTSDKQTKNLQKKLGAWKPDEDSKLVELVKRDGTKSSDWDAKAIALGTGRSASAVTFRWYRHLKKLAERTTSSVDPELPVGSRIKARWLGGKCWYPGVIRRVNDNLTRDIHYDDGEDEQGVKVKHIRLADTKQKNGSSKEPSKAKRPKSTTDKKPRATKDKDADKGGWSHEERAQLLDLIADSGPGRWSEKAAQMSKLSTSTTVRTDAAVSNQWNVRLKTTPAGLQALRSFEGKANGGLKPASISIQPAEQTQPMDSDEVETTANSELLADPDAEQSASSVTDALPDSTPLPTPSPSPRSSLPPEERDKVDTVVSCTGCDGETAIQLLHRSGWETDSAVTRWFDRPIRLRAGTGVEKYEPTQVAASQWSSASSLHPGIAPQLHPARASLASIFAERKKREQQGETYAQMYPTRKVSLDELRALEAYVPYTRATVPGRVYNWIDTEAGEMPVPSDLVKERVPAIRLAWEHAAGVIQRKTSRPLKKVEIGKLQSPEHPSVKYGGAAGAFALFAAEPIKKGGRIGYVNACMRFLKFLRLRCNSCGWHCVVLCMFS